MNWVFSVCVATGCGGRGVVNWFQWWLSDWFAEERKKEGEVAGRWGVQRRKKKEVGHGNCGSVGRKS